MEKLSTSTFPVKPFLILSPFHPHILIPFNGTVHDLSTCILFNVYIYKFVIYLGSRTPFESPTPQITTWTSQPVHWFFAFSSFNSAVRASIFCSRSVFCLFKSSFSVMSYSTSVSDGAPKLFFMNSMTLGGFSGSS